MAPRYVKKSLEFSQREKSAEKYFMKPIATPTTSAQRSVGKFFVFYDYM